jgi:uncharacterized membrane-anchored protein
MDKKKLFIGIAVFWLIAIVGFIAIKEYTLQTGEEVILKTRPVDPRDLFRGDYVILNYEIGNVDISDFEEGDKIYVGLQVDENGYGESTGVYKNPPESLFIKGTVKRDSWVGSNVEFGIESYFVPEGEGRAVERNRNLEGKVAIDKSGNAVLKAILIDGEEISFD